MVDTSPKLKVKKVLIISPTVYICESHNISQLYSNTFIYSRHYGHTVDKMS